MPVSRNRKKKHRPSSILSKADIRKKEEAYYKKLQEYDGYELEQLITMRDSGTVKGVHLNAIMTTINIKNKINVKIKEHAERNNEEIAGEGIIQSG